jgi:hypothetical protein
VHKQAERQLHLFAILGLRFVSMPPSAYAYLSTLKKPKNLNMHSVGYISRCMWWIWHMHQVISKLKPDKYRHALLGYQWIEVHWICTTYIFKFETNIRYVYICVSMNYTYW